MGNPPKRLYNLIRLAEKNIGSSFTACIVECSDGKFLFPFARKKVKVTGYEIDETALYGGYKDFPIIKDNEIYKYTEDFISKEYEVENKYVCGILNRLKQERLEKYANVEKRDFYKNVPNKKFDVVFTSCSLHYSLNKEFTHKEKVEKLQSIVANGGYIYIDYMMAIDESNLDKYPINKYFRKGEMKKYFDKSWRVISIVEKNIPTFEKAHVECTIDHFHKFGYVLAQKI